jgi:hypothetical protein
MADNRPLAGGVMLALVLFGAAAGARAAGPAGQWKGAIQTPGQELQVEVQLAAKGPGAWIGDITIPAQGLRAFPLSSIEVQGNAVSFAMKGIPGDPLFKGTLSNDGATLAGDFTQGGTRLSFQLKRTGEAAIAEAPTSTAIAKELEGSWKGSLDAGGKVLRLELRLSNRPEGGATGSMVSVDQGGVEIPIATITQAASRLELKLPSIGGTYSGELKEGRLTGEWTQGMATLPLVFTRATP